MKKFYALLLVAFSLPAFGQSVYWSEGFESGTNIGSTSGDPSWVPDYFEGTSSAGTWYKFGAYRTNGGSTNNCSAEIPTIGISHIRMRGNDASQPYIVTPVVENGIGQFRFIKGRASRVFNIYKTSDTAALSNNWTLVAEIASSEPICQLFTTVDVNDPAAKRIKIVGQGGGGASATDSDFDSISLTSTSPLPLTWGAIDAKLDYGKVALLWKTYNEEGLYQFVVQRSRNGISFEDLGAVVSKNAVSAEYVYLDEPKVAGQYFYRIKNIELDGKQTLSPVVRVLLNDENAENVIIENPAKNGQVAIRLSKIPSGIYQVSILNASGQRMNSTSINVQGTTNITVPVGHMHKSGILVVRVEGAEFSQTRKIIMQ